MSVGGQSGARVWSIEVGGQSRVRRGVQSRYEEGDRENEMRLRPRKRQLLELSFETEETRLCRIKQLNRRVCGLWGNEGYSVRDEQTREELHG